MPARLWNCVVLMTVMVAGTSGMPMPSFAQAKEQIAHIKSPPPDHQH